MFRRTVPLSRTITTWFGQRRILKRRDFLPQQVRLQRAVESGVYRTKEEIAAMLRDRQLQQDPVRQVMKRFRQDIVRGASVHDYPVEYLIVRQHPPSPFEGLVPKSLVRQMDKLEREKQERRIKARKEYEYLQKLTNGAWGEKQRWKAQQRMAAMSAAATANADSTTTSTFTSSSFHPSSYSHAYDSSPQFYTPRQEFHALVQFHLERQEELSKSNKNNNNNKNPHLLTPNFDNPHEYHNGAPLTGDEFAYRRLLGVPHPQRTTLTKASFPFAKQHAAYQRAKQAAERHFVINRELEHGIYDPLAQDPRKQQQGQRRLAKKFWTPEKSHQEATLDQVDQLLHDAARQEYERAAKVLVQAQKLQQQQQQQQAQNRKQANDADATTPNDTKKEKKTNQSSSSPTTTTTTTMAQLAKAHEDARHESWRRLVRGGRAVDPQEPQNPRGDPLYWTGNNSSNSNTASSSSSSSSSLDDWNAFVRQYEHEHSPIKDVSSSTSSNSTTTTTPALPSSPPPTPAQQSFLQRKHLTLQAERLVQQQQQQQQQPPPKQQSPTPNTQQDSHTQTKTSLETVFENVLQSKPETLVGMMQWSQRLQAVPYVQWTVGAATALDHWVATQVLQYSEATWQTLLEGTTDPTYLSRGRVLLETRQALFPETVADDNNDDDDEQDDPREQLPIEERDPAFRTELEQIKLQSARKQSSLEELLNSLGELTIPESSIATSTTSNDQTTTTTTTTTASSSSPSSNDEDATTSTTTTTTTTTASSAEYTDDQVDELMNQLQAWRKMQKQQPYEQWPKAQKDALNDWIKTIFLPVCGGGGGGGGTTTANSNQTVDLDATRHALLTAPPTSRQASDDFWSSLSNEVDATRLLDELRHDQKVPICAKDLIQESFFTQLDRSQQLDHLLNLGALRPLLDENARESDRQTFLDQFGDVLLTGVPMEYLIPDPNGPIGLSDLQQRGQGGASSPYSSSFDQGLDTPMIRELASRYAKALEQRNAGLPLTPAQQMPLSEPRFRLELLPYRGAQKDTAPLLSDDNDNDDNDSSSSLSSFSSSTTTMAVTRALYEAWNEHKANRARYEEYLFQQQELGLEYDHPPHPEGEAAAERLALEQFDGYVKGLHDDDEDDEDDDDEKKKKKQKKKKQAYVSLLNRHEVAKLRDYEARMRLKYPPPRGSPMERYSK
ncbi:hypothetical protein ACA910_007145 [Epithemia clementina (nom. ined.)]